jgi:ubiquinone/menaquinone biosynthesis C-methylase UbiE
MGSSRAAPLGGAVYALAMAAEPGSLFDHVAEDYDRVRPTYPASLVDTVCSTAALGPGSRVVEVGCGTGKLTVALADRGLRVEAVDPGARMIECARRSVGDASVRFHLARFEEVVLPAQAFEAVFSATAFHWVDPSVGWAKAARLLRPGGVLALLAHVDCSVGELETEFLAAWREVLPKAEEWELRDRRTLREGAESRRGNVSELWAWLMRRELGRPEVAALFEEAEVTWVPVEREETSQDVLAFLRTTSTYLQLDRDRRGRLERRLTEVLDRAGGSYRSTILAALVTARAVG